MSDTSIELTWDLAYEKEGIINYELRCRDSLGTQARILALLYDFNLKSVFGIEGRSRPPPASFAVVSRQIF